MTRARPDLDVSPVALDFPTRPLCWPEVFGNDRPVELEVGPGKGLFLANAGRQLPDRNFVGVEMASKYARLAAERLAKDAIPNAKVWPGDARIVLSRHIPAASLRVVHVYFPDPWWKKRHKKRRVFTEALVTEIQRILEPGGQLRVASDVEEYFAVIRDLIAASPRFRELPLPQPNEPRHDLDYLTSFERKYLLEGRPIYRAFFELCG